MANFKCPCCGASERLGVWFTKTEIKIVDRLIRAGDNPVSYKEFQPDFKLYTLKVHVYNINNKLEETDWRIRGRGDGYKFVMEKVPEIA